MSDPAFEAERAANLAKLVEAKELARVTNTWLIEATELRYTYHFDWLGRPIIQLPQDMVAMQEIIWKVKPDLIIETGIARGGSLIYYASLQHLLGGEGRVLGIDIDIRQHNRVEIEAHPMFDRIDMIEGSSIDPAIAERVVEAARGAERVLVVLDSNHTHDHVLEELKLYSPLVTEGSYLVVFDTIVEELPDRFFADRPWGVGNNPLTAVRAFLPTTDRFEVDTILEAKLQITSCREGYLKCVKGR